MPRRKRHNIIASYDREAIRRQSGLPLSAIDQAALRMRLFTPPGEALMALRKTLIQTENILHDRPADFHRLNSTPGPVLEHMSIPCLLSNGRRKSPPVSR